MKEEFVKIRSQIGLKVCHPSSILTVDKIHNIPCPNCEYGVVRNWFGFAKKCPVCNGTYSIGEYTTKHIFM